jgi:hypothetical protein
LVAAVEHEEMLRLIVQPFFIDVAMVEFVESLGDGLDQSADNLLKGFQRAVDVSDGDRAVVGVDDDRAHGEASGSGLSLPRT